MVTPPQYKGTENPELLGNTLKSEEPGCFSSGADYTNMAGTPKPLTREEKGANYADILKQGGGSLKGGYDYISKTGGTEQDRTGFAKWMEAQGKIASQGTTSPLKTGYEIIGAAGGTTADKINYAKFLEENKTGYGITPTTTTTPGVATGTGTSMPIYAPTNIDPKTGIGYDASGKPYTGGTWVNGVNKGTTPTTTTTTTGTQTETTDINKDYIITADELGGEEKSVYDMLSPTEQAQFLAIGEAARKAGQDYTKAQVEYLKKWKENRDYLTSQEEKRKKVEGISGEISDIQSSETINNAKNQLSNLKQNLAYIGSMGTPGISSAKLDAVSNQIQKAENTYANILKTQQLISEARKIGEEGNAEQFERQLKVLQDDLDQKVNISIQNALNNLTSADLAGKLDSVEEIEKLRIGLLDNLDKEIAGITDANISQRQFLIERYDKIATNAQKYIENKQAVNLEMSQVQGYYVDGNGDPIISATTGQRIQIPQSAPMDPIFDQKTGKLIQFAYDENGNIVADVQQVIEQPTFQDETIANYAQLVVDGKLKMEDIPDSVKTTESFINYLTQSKKLDDVTYGVIGKDENGNDIYGWINKTKQTVTYGDGSTTIGPSIDVNEIVAFSQDKRKNTKLQCGQLVNDFILKETGKDPSGISRFADSYQSKVNAVKSIGKSDIPQVGGIFVLDTGTVNGHTGIVVGVNKDGSIDVLEANAGGLTQGEEPTINTYEDLSGMTFSKPITTPKEGMEGKEYTQTQKNLMFGMDAKNLSKTDMNILKKNGLNAEDVYNFKYSQKEGKWSQGLDDTEYKRINTIVDDISTNQVTKTFQKAQEAYESAIQFAKGESATDNQALIYAFAKAMDPDSVVREGEYATVQKYSQVWGDKLGMNINRILNGQEFISPQAKNNIVNSIKSKYEASKKTYENLRNTKIKMINDIAGKNIGEQAAPSEVMDIGAIKMFEDGTYIEYDNKGNYRYYGKDKVLSDWQPVGGTELSETTGVGTSKIPEGADINALYDKIVSGQGPTVGNPYTTTTGKTIDLSGLNDILTK